MISIETTGDMLTRLRHACEGRGQTAKVAKTVLSQLLIEYDRMLRELQSQRQIREH